MAINPTSLIGNMRITGISSGLDTDSIISDMMKVEQLKLDRVSRSKTSLEWKLDAYNDVNTKLRQFRDKYFSVLSTKTSLVSSDAYKNYNVSMTENTAIKLSAGSGLIAKNISVLSVQAAKGASVTGTAGQSRKTELASATDLRFAKASGEVGYVTDTSVRLDDESLTHSGKNIFGLSEANSTVAFSINGQNFSFTGQSTIDDVLAAVNASSAGVKMTFAEGKFTIAQEKIASNIIIGNEKGTAFGASGAFGLSIGATLPNTALDAAITLEALAAMQGKSVDDSLSFSLNGESLTFSKDDTLGDVLDAITASEANLQARLADGKLTLRSKTAGTSPIALLDASGQLFGADGILGITPTATQSPAAVKRTDSLATAAFKLTGQEPALDENGQIAISINGKNFTFDPSTSVSEFTQTISKSDAGVTLQYSEIIDGFTLSTNTTGANATLSFSGLDAFGLASQTVQGQNAKVVVDTGAGGPQTIEQAGNTFSMDGIQFEITGDYSGEKPITASFSLNVDQTIDRIKAFITEYNDLITSLSTQLKEKRNYDYQPLTETEREGLSEKEIELWEEKAKSGVLRNDARLSGLINSLRSAVYQAVGDTGYSPAQLGIRTRSWSSSGETQNGQLVFDAESEEKLRGLLQNDPDLVARVFADVADTGDTATKQKNSGLFTRMSSLINNYATSARAIEIKNTEKDIERTDIRLSAMTVQMYRKQERYWTQFSQMERVMSNLNAQSSWMSAQLGGSN